MKALCILLILFTTKSYCQETPTWTGKYPKHSQPRDASKQYSRLAAVAAGQYISWTKTTVRSVVPKSSYQNIFRYDVTKHFRVTDITTAAEVIFNNPIVLNDKVRSTPTFDQRPTVYKKQVLISNIDYIAESLKSEDEITLKSLLRPIDASIERMTLDLQKDHSTSIEEDILPEIEFVARRFSRMSSRSPGPPQQPQRPSVGKDVTASAIEAQPIPEIPALDQPPIEIKPILSPNVDMSREPVDSVLDKTQTDINQKLHDIDKYVPVEEVFKLQNGSVRITSMPKTLQKPPKTLIDALDMPEKRDQESSNIVFRNGNDETQIDINKIFIDSIPKKNKRSILDSVFPE